MRGRVTVILVGLVLSSCSRTDPHATPEAAGRAFLEAADRRDVDAMLDVVIAPERLRRALACPPAGGKIDVIDAVAYARETMAERAGMGYRLVSVDELSRRTVAAGDDYRGCRVTEPFELRRMRFHLSADDDGDEKIEDGDVIRLDGAWRMVVPS